MTFGYISSPFMLRMYKYLSNLTLYMYKIYTACILQSVKKRQV